METEDEVDDELSEAIDTEVIKQFALMLLSLQLYTYDLNTSKSKTLCD